MNLLIILENTFREGFAKKTIIGLIAISTIFLVVVTLLAVFVNMDNVISNEAIKNPPTLIQFQRAMQAGLMGLINFPAMVLSIFATAGIMTSTLEKGYIDLLLSKPVSRNELLIGRFLGGLSIVFVNYLYFGIGLWIITSLKIGQWDANLLLGLLCSYLGYVVILPFMMLISLYMRSTALVMILTYVFTFIVNPILSAKDAIYNLVKSDFLLGVMNFFYQIIPKPSDVAGLSQPIIMQFAYSWTPVITSLISATVLFGLAIFLFRKRDL